MADPAFQDQTAFLTTAEAERRSRKLDGRAGKRIDPTLCLQRRQAAARRPALLARRHLWDQTSFPNDNPSSTRYELLTAIAPAGEPPR